MLFSLPSVLACALLAHLSSARSDQVVLSGNPPLADGPASDALALDEHGRDTFEGYSVVRFNVSSPEKRQELVRFAELHHLDIWAHHSASADVLLPPHLPLSSAAFDSLTASLPEHSTFIANVGHHITYPSTSSSSSSSLAFGRKKRKQRKPTPAPESPNSNRTVIPIDIPFHDSYHQVDAFFDFLIDLEETWPELVDVFSIGNSSEGREIPAIRIGFEPTEPGRKKKKGGRRKKKLMEDGHEAEEEGFGSTGEPLRKPEFVIMGGQHAREWISPASSLYFAHYLLVNSEKPAIKALLHAIDFTIIPAMNVDGYDYTFTKSRLWRKTRSITDSKLGCRGIDPNRNWGYRWEQVADDLASSPCSENFPGRAPFDAPETRAVADYLKTQKALAFIDLHSYGELLMFPFSYSCKDYPPDAEDLLEALLGATKAIKSVRGTEYKTGEVCELVFRYSGDSVDWTYGVEDIKWSFSMELPDTGTFGFLIPPRLIRGIAEESVEAWLYLAAFVVKKAKL